MSQHDPEGFSCIGCRSVTGISAGEVIRTFSDGGYSVQPVRAVIVFGLDHVRSACIHAERSYIRGRSVSSDVMTEVARYIGCNRQLSRALELVKVDGEKEIVIITRPRLNEEDEGRILGTLGLQRDDSVAKVTKSKIRNAPLLGVKSKSMNDIREEVLERVALLDVER